MIAQDKLFFLNQLLDHELNQLSKGNELQELHDKISNLENHIQKNIDRQLGSQQSIIERAFPTLGCREQEEDFTPIKQTERKSNPARSTSLKKKKSGADKKNQKKSIDRIDKQMLLQEKQKSSQLQNQNKELAKKLKKAENTITQLKQDLIEHQKYKENFQKSEYIRTQQKELIKCLKKEIDSIKKK